MAIAEPAKLIAEKNEIKVKSISEGEEKNLILECSVSTVDVHSAVKPRYDEFLGTSVKKHRASVADPNLIYAGQMLVIPAA